MSDEFFKFTPQPDITAFELAQVIKNLDLQVRSDVMEAMDPGLGRHFKLSITPPFEILSGPTPEEDAILSQLPLASPGR